MPGPQELPQEQSALFSLECCYFLLRKRFKSFPKESQTTWSADSPGPNAGIPVQDWWDDLRLVPSAGSLLGLLDVSSAPCRAGQRENVEEVQKCVAESSADIAVLISITKDRFSVGFGGEIWDWFLWGFNGMSFIS